MTLRLRLLLWLAPLAVLLVAFSIWIALHQSLPLEVQNPPANQKTVPDTARAAAPSLDLNIQPAVPTPKTVPLEFSPRSITLSQLQTRREPALLRFSAGQLEEVRATDLLNQSTIWLWAVLLLSAALLFGSVGVRRSLVPLDRFAAEIASRNSNQLEALANPPLPELKPAVTALNGLLEDLRLSLRRARLQEQSAKRFAFNASHELRNPLTTARNYLEILERHPAEPHAATQALEAIRRTEQMLDSLLTLARLEGHGTVTGQTITLHDFLEANFELPVVGQAAITAERDLLELAIDNLVKNATDHGGGAHQFVLEQRDHLTWIWLEDAGTGFAPSLLPEVFEPFVKRGHGTGLGLAIVAAVADVHGGAVKAENLAFGGARVGIGLPHG